MQYIEIIRSNFFVFNICFRKLTSMWKKHSKVRNDFTLKRRFFFFFRGILYLV